MRYGPWAMARGTLITLEVVFSLALLVAAVLERVVHLGVHRDLLITAFLLAPLHARRLLAIAGRGCAPHAALHALEALALAGALGVYPPGGASLGPASVVSLLLAWSSAGLNDEGSREP